LLTSIMITVYHSTGESAMHKKSTDELLKLISKESRLDTFLKNNAEEFEATSLKDELARLSSLHHTTKADIIRLSLLDKTYTYQILDGKKTNPSRNKLLAICLAIGATLEETQRVLRLGHAEQLHPRNIRDSVIIYSINHHTSVLDTNQILYDMGKEPLM
jgi:uncharacterized protein YfaS (alpha-2-macroglobulin family)